MADDNKAERKIKVFCKNGIWVEGPDGRAKKVAKGKTVLLSANDIKHFGKAVTKDIPEDEE